MLNRRFLRIKIMQALYAYFQAPETPIREAEKELLSTFNNINTLYLWLLSLLKEVHVMAENSIEEAKNKKLPKQQDLNPNTRFIQNSFLKSLSADKIISAILEKKKIRWGNDDDLVRKIFNDIKKSNAYQSYMQDSTLTIENEKKFVLDLFEEVIEEHEFFHYYFEEKNVHWADDLFVACIGLRKTIDTFDGSKVQLQDLYKNEEEDIEFSKNLFSLCIQNNSRFQQMISEKTVNWEVERIAQMDVLLMKMALTEVMFFENIPVKVSLNEYIDISKEYSTPKSKVFINGILDKIVIEQKRENKIVKTGRGLKEN